LFDLNDLNTQTLSSYLPFSQSANSQTLAISLSVSAISPRAIAISFSLSLHTCLLLSFSVFSSVHTEFVQFLLVLYNDDDWRKAQSTWRSPPLLQISRWTPLLLQRFKFQISIFYCFIQSICSFFLGMYTSVLVSPLGFWLLFIFLHLLLCFFFFFLQQFYLI
jgi:hypothetical protein